MPNSSFNEIQRTPLTQESSSSPYQSNQTSLNHENKGVSAVFKNDSLKQATPSTAKKETESNEVAATPSWFTRLTTLFKKKSASEKTPAIEEKKEDLKIVSHIPTLEKPEKIDNALLPLNGLTKKSTLSIPELESIVQEMNTKTIDQIMFIVMQEFLVQEKEDLITTDQIYEKYNSLRKNKNNVLKQIKDVILADENLSSKFKKASTVLSAASFLCGLAATSIMFGVNDAIANTLKDGFKDLFSSSIKHLAAAAPATAVACVGTQGFKAYLSHHRDEEMAKMILNEHHLRYYDDKSSQMLDRVGQIAGNDFQKRMYGEFIKQNERIIPLIFQTKQK